MNEEKQPGLNAFLDFVAERSRENMETDLDWGCADAIGQCQSPIEFKMLFAMLQTCYGNGVETQVRFAPAGAWCTVDDHCKAQRWRITPQWPHDKKRIDFHIEHSEFAGWDGSDPTYDSWVLLIECDGHDFHERTKEQARKDRSRDRELIADGLPVFRFTGQEIHEDALGCAEEIYDYFGAKVKELRAAKVAP